MLGFPIFESTPISVRSRKELFHASSHLDPDPADIRFSYLCAGAEKPEKPALSADGKPGLGISMIS